MAYIYITGGASSGKSRFALDLFRDMKDVSFIATGAAADPEMEERIRTHRDQRPQTWETLEEQLDLVKAVKNTDRRHRGIIIDCLTFWVSNLIYSAHFSHEHILSLARTTAFYLEQCSKKIAVVSGELGMGVVPPTPEGRSFRKTAGEVNQIFSAKSKNAYLVVSGITLNIK
ncbi:MAG: bifunctional adenosylcobinamide kinase/adenosylcobinamide-phosphate guanylyltransferase [Spirochaetota bacterium]